jgi:hypothetical protein
MEIKRIQQIGFVYSAIAIALLMVANLPVLFYQKPLLRIHVAVGFLAIFLLWGLMIYYLYRIHGKSLKLKEMVGLSLFEKTKVYLNHPPQWLFVPTGIFYLYGCYCHYLSFTTAGTIEPTLVDGRYQSVYYDRMTHLEHVYYYTEAEYLVLLRQICLAESGLLLSFAIVSFTVFYPKKEMI